jgi:hypothetical protein
LHGYVGEIVHFGEGIPLPSEVEGVERIPLAHLFSIPNNKIIDVLHLDVQGSEVSVLQEMLDNNLFSRVRFIFCSLHQTHEQCREILEKSNRKINYIFDSASEGGLGDGLIVCELS